MNDPAQQVALPRAVVESLVKLAYGQFTVQDMILGENFGTEEVGEIGVVVAALEIAARRQDVLRGAEQDELKALAALKEVAIDMVRWFRAHDGAADDFGRLNFVARAEETLKTLGWQE